MVNTHENPPFAHQTLAEIVTADTRAAAIFDRAGLDYCCHGRRPLEEAAAEKGIPLAPLLADLSALGPATPDARDLAEPVELDALTGLIVARHHAYVRAMSPRIEQWLAKLVARHGDRHPELSQVQHTFGLVADELRSHMMKEESILFPYINALAAASRGTQPPPVTPFGTILNPIRVMEEDHREAGDQLEQLRALTSDYTTPEDGCTTYRVCYEELGRFAADLHQHVHLENNVLFPRAVALEEALT